MGRPVRLTVGPLPALAAPLGAVYLLLFASTAGTHAQQAVCGPARAHTVVADAQARVYRVRVGDSLQGALYAYYGCAVSRNEPEPLWTDSPLGHAGAVKLNRVMAGFIVDQAGVDTGSTTLTIVNLARDRVVHTVSASYVVPRSYHSLVAYVVSASGNIAWSEVSSIGLGSERTVKIRRELGHTITTLDQGANIRPSSLRLNGHSVSWIAGGHRRHARLP